MKCVCVCVCVCIPLCVMVNKPIEVPAIRMEGQGVRELVFGVAQSHTNVVQLFTCITQHHSGTS